MSAFLSWPPLLWAQQAAPEVPTYLKWLYVWGDPGVTDGRILIGAPITWMKVVGLFCLMGWTLSWVAAATRRRDLAPLRKPGLIALGVGLGLGLMSVVMQVLDQTGRAKLPSIAGGSPAVIFAWGCGLVVLAWVEALLWSSIRKEGTKADLSVLVGIHLALAFGVMVAFLIQRSDPNRRISVPLMFTAGARLGATYMGLVVLARVFVLMSRELAALRWRRLYAIAWQTWVESFRRMWAPWVVLVVFGIILAFTDWFLKPPRDAELSRLYVGTLALLTSLLVTVMVGVLSPISLPHDIQRQTIYTIVSKPVRRLELVWGRLLGFMALVTVLLLVFGGISLGYLERTVGGTVANARAAARKAASEGREAFARQYNEQADQLEGRWSARVPVHGVLTFKDSRGNDKRLGIDVGQEQQTRSFVEGATPSMAIWNFGVVPNPLDPAHNVDRRIPVDRLLKPGTIEEKENRLAELGDDLEMARAQQGSATIKAADAASITAGMTQIADRMNVLRDEIKQMRARDKDLRDRASKDRSAAPALLAEAAEMHSPDIPIEMALSIYRTTKGQLGEPVYASLVVRNRRPGVPPYRAYLPIHEYYTDKHMIPASAFVGSRGFARVEVQCLTPNQYLGMGEADLYILARQGRFWDNYLRGLFGIWLQAMVLTAIGVFAGTFLSWPVALVTTMAFFVAGQAAFNFLQTIAMQSLEGGGPFESLIRLLSHDNLQSALDPTLSVVTAKSLDSLVMPVLSRLVYVVPNFAAMDVSNIVADGYAVTWDVARDNLLLALGYVLPFSVAGYFILKNREVAA